jgi:class 3 adenylate cyclase/tetratricopeptide (TPR) repeat protein
MRCSNCGSENPAGKKFCGDCGASLDQAADIRTTETRGARAGKRRHLTVLFCDLVGSTEIAARLDPEEWREILASYHRAVTEAINRFGGYVAQYLGDGVMAYFGWPESHDNAAESAGRAGLAIVEQIAKLSPQPGHTKLSARVGIDSGAVVVGAGAGKEADVFGDVPNIAARTQAAAEADTVVVTGATQQLILGLFVVEDRGAQSVRGIERPLQLYRLIRPSGARGRLEATATARGLTGFVGREKEVRLLMNSWERTLAGEGQAVLIIGEPGIGKSRLVQQFRQRIAGIPHAWAEAAASRFFQNTPFYAVADAVRTVQEIYSLGRVSAAQGRSRRRTSPVNTEGSNGQSTNRAPAKIEEQVKRLRSALEWESDPSVAQLFVAVRGESPAPQFASGEQRRRLMSALVKWVLSATKVMPVVIAIEDLHWADPSTLELIELLVQQSGKAPLMLLQTARPEFHVGWQPSTHLVHISLNALNSNSARTMVAGVAGQTILPEETIKAVVERAGGVPLFIEELTRVVLESGNDDRGAHPIPATLHDSLMARLDRLGPARETLQVGAVLGTEFGYELIRAVTPLNEDELQRHLLALTDAELLYELGVKPDASYQFKHVLIRDAAYEALLKSQRRELHTRIALTIEQKFPELAASRPETLAYHYTEAGVIAKAVRYWRKAGQKASDRSANVEAIAQLRKGLELLLVVPVTSDRLIEEVKLQIALTTPLIAIAGYTAPDVEKASNRALELCQQIGDAPQLFAVLGRLNSIYFNRSELGLAHELAKQMLRIAAARHDPALLLWAHYALGFTLSSLGKLKSARNHLERSIALYEPHRAGSYGYVQDPGPTALAMLSQVVYALGYPEQALNQIQRALALARTLSHPFTLAWVLGFAGDLFWKRREKSKAQECWNEGATLSTEQGFKPLLESASFSLGFALAEQQGGADGIAKMQAVYARYSSIDALPIGDKVRWTGLLGFALGKAGEPAQGMARIDEALAIARNITKPKDLCDLYLFKGQLHLMQNPHAIRKPKQCFSMAIQIAREIGAKADELIAAIEIAKLLKRQGRGPQARETVAEMYNWFTEGFDTANLKEAKALLDELSD